MNKVINIIKELNPFNNKKIDNKIIYILKILLTTGLIYFISLIIGEVIIIGGSYFFGYNATDKQMPYNIMLLCTFYGYIITILMFLLYTKKINKIKLEKIGLNKNIKTIVKGIIIGIISISVITIILIMCGAIQFNGINNNINWLFLILYFFAYLIQSFMEELVCRGFLFHRLKEKTPTFFATIICILFFSYGHLAKMFNDGLLIGIIGITNLLLISILFVILTLKDKNIYSAVGFHFIWNFSLFNVIGLNLSGVETTNSIFKIDTVNNFLTGYSYGIESSIVCTIIITIILIFLLKKNNKSTNSLYN